MAPEPSFLRLQDGELVSLRKGIKFCFFSSPAASSKMRIHSCQLEKVFPPFAEDVLFWTSVLEGVVGP